MIKLKKYNHNTEPAFHSKIISYAALASAFLAYTPVGYTQCGTADPSTPLLPVDIDGDGNSDINILFQSTTSPGQVYATVLGPNPVSTNIFAGTFTLSITGTVSVPAALGSYFGCNIGPVPGGTMGFAGGSYYNMPLMTGTNPTNTYTAMDTGMIQYYANAFGVTAFYLFTNTYFINFAYASAAAGNQILGFTSGGSNICEPVCTASSTVASLGYNVNQYYNGFIADAFYYYTLMVDSTTLIATATASNWPTATCFTVSYATYGFYFPAVPSSVISPTVTATTVYSGQSINTSIPTALYNVTLATGTRLFVPNTNPTSFLAVKFEGPDLDGDGNPDHYLGWVELSIDPSTSAITCVGTGYNACSIELANLSAGTSDACPSLSDIALGSADPESDCSLCTPSNGPLIINGSSSSGARGTSQKQ